MKKMAMMATVVFALGGVTEAVAQTTADGQATVTIPQVLMIRSVTDLSIVLAAGDFSDSDTAVGTGSVTVETRANVVHSVTVSGSDLMNEDDAITIEVEAAAGGFSDVNATAVTALSALGRGSQSSQVNFQATADVATHAPGTYQGTITYTVVAD